MSKQISFIHAADLHLDSPFKGLANSPEHIFQKIRESTFVALDRLVSCAINKQVDFVLLTGDIFDNEKQSLKAQVRLRRAFGKLKSHQINVYLSYGNHDYINGNIHPVTYPDNVFVFPDESVSQFNFMKNGSPVAAIYGFSYKNRAVIANKTDEYKIVDKQIPFHIAMLHGTLRSNTDHDLYAPFQISDLTKSHFDYWALGHIHQQGILKQCPPIVYPGNTQGRNRKETGEKGCYHVVLSETKETMDFIPLQALQFNSVPIDVSNCEEIHQVENTIQEMLRSQHETTTPQLLELILVGDNPNIIKWKNEKNLDEIIELVNETWVSQNNWLYIFRFSVETIQKTFSEELIKSDHFVGELVRHFDEKSIKPFLKDLFNHKHGRKYLDPLSKGEEQEIKDEAKTLLINELLNEGGKTY